VVKIPVVCDSFGADSHRVEGSRIQAAEPGADDVAEQAAGDGECQVISWVPGEELAHGPGVEKAAGHDGRVARRAEWPCDQRAVMQYQPQAQPRPSTWARVDWRT
jgi:hypothetical protein